MVFVHSGPKPPKGRSCGPYIVRIRSYSRKASPKGRTGRDVAGTRPVLQMRRAVTQGCSGSATGSPNEAGGSNRAWTPGVSLSPGGSDRARSPGESGNPGERGASVVGRARAGRALAFMLGAAQHVR